MDKPLLLNSLSVFKDERGLSFEVLNSSLFSKLNFPEMVLDYCSWSKRNVVRGLHFRVPWQVQIVTVIQGSILDVLVDVNPASKNFGKSHYFAMDGGPEGVSQLIVPEGYAHGFR
jgi:dTDP-4-dehydrorhamnose 3,5-epimerase